MTTSTPRPRLTGRPRRTDARRYWIGAVLLSVLVSVAANIRFAVAHVDLIDLRVYRMGGRLVGQDAELYRAQFEILNLPFTYPPIAAIAMWPLAVVPFWVAVTVWTTASVLAIAGVCRVCLPDLKPILLVGAVLATFLLEPVQETLFKGQINTLLMAMVVLDLVRRDGARWRGVSTGLATAIKLTPVLFLVFLLVTRQWTALRNAVVGILAAVAIGFAVMPRASWDYWTEEIRDAERIGGLSFAGNQSILGLLTRIGEDSAWVRPVWFVLACGFALLGLWLARRFWSSGDRLTAISVVALAGLFASPVSWSHHWVWVIPVGVVAVRAVADFGVRARTWVFGVAWFGVFVAQPMWLVPFRDEAELTWNLWQSLLGNGYLLAGVAAFLVLGWRVTRPNREVELTP